MDPLTITLFLAGFVLLIKGADVLVEGASALAARYGVSELVIGLTIVSFGTSMPEVAVSVLAALDGHTDLAIGNVLGSNIANTLLVLGVAAMVAPLPVHSRTILSEIPFSLTAALLVGFLANAHLFTNRPELSITRLDGLVLLFFLGLFFAYIVKVARDGQSMPIAKGGPERPQVVLARPWLASGYVALGTVALYLGGEWVVDGALALARTFGLSQSFIGLTVIAIGTSLPELVTSAVAAYRKSTDIAVGNVIGSNIFNLLWVLGLTAVIADLPFDQINNTDIAMVIFASTMLIVALALGQRGIVERWNGASFVLIYLAYLAYLTQRG